MPSKDKPKRGNPACVPPTCSCAKCDSMFCSSKKDVEDVCSCDDCTESRNCLFYSNRLVRVNNHISQASEPCGVGDNNHSNFFKCLPNIHNDVSTSTFEALKNTIELCKSILERPRNTIENLKNLYNKTQYPSSTCCRDPRHQKPMSITKQDKDNNCVCDYDDLQNKTSDIPIKQKPVSKSSILPQTASSYWEQPLNFRGKDIPEYGYILQKNIQDKTKSIGCNEPSVLPDGLPPNISNPPGFTFVRQKLECPCDETQKVCQCSRSDESKKCSCYPNETQKQTTVHRASLPGCVYGLQKRKDKNELPKKDDLDFKYVLQKHDEPTTDHRVSIPGYIYALHKQQDSKKNTCGLPKLDDQDFTYVLENVTHDSVAPPESNNAPNNAQSHRTSEPGFVYGLQKRKNKNDFPKKDNLEYKYVLQNPIESTKSHRVSIPGYIYALQKQQDSKINTGGLPKPDDQDYKYVIENVPRDAFSHPVSKNAPKVSQPHRISEPGFVYALQKRKDKKDISKKDDLEYKYVLQNPIESKKDHRASIPGYIYALQKQHSKSDTCCSNIPVANEPDYNKNVVQRAQNHPEGKHEMQKHAYPSETAKVSQATRITEPGFVYSLQKSKPDLKPDTCCGKLPAANDYKYVLQNAPGNPEHKQDIQKHTYPSETPKVPQANCISEPGFVYVLQKSKPDLKPNTCCGKLPGANDYKYVLQNAPDNPEPKQEIQKHTYPCETKKSKPDLKPDSRWGKLPATNDYKYMLQNAHGHPEGKHEMQKHTEPGSVYALQKSKPDLKPDTCCGKLPAANDYKYVLQNAHGHPEGKLEMQKHTYPNETPKVSQGHRISEPGSVYALQKQKHDSKSDTCCGKIPEAEESEYKYVLQNAYDHPEGKHEMQKLTPSEPPKVSRSHRISEPGFVYALQKSKQDSKKDTCCGKLSKADEFEYKYVLQNTHEFAKTYPPEHKHGSPKPRYETKKYPCSIPPQESLRSLSDPNIYTYVLQKPAHESKTGTCCRGPKDLPETEPPEYLFILQKRTPSKNVCNHDELPKESLESGRHKHGSCSYHETHRKECEKHGHLNELLKHRHEGSNDKCQKVCKHKLERKKTETIKRRCECNQGSKDTSDQQKPDETGGDSLKLCINVVKPPPERKTTCSCKSSTAEHSTSRAKSEPQKYSTDEKKNSLELCKNILEIQKNAIETLNSIYLTQIKSCECNKVPENPKSGYGCVPPKRSHESAKDSHDSSKHDFGNSSSKKGSQNTCDQSQSCCEPSKQSHGSAKDSNESTKKCSNTNNSEPTDCCEPMKKKPENISELPEYSCEPQKHHSHESMKKAVESTTTLECCSKPSKHSKVSIKPSLETLKNNLESQNSATKTLKLEKIFLGDNPCCNESVNVPIETHVCVLEQPIPKILPHLSKLECKESDKESSESKSREPMKNTLSECNNVHTKEDTNARDSYYSDASKKCEIPEYIFELHKYTQEPSNNTQNVWINRIETADNKQDSCGCKYSTKRHLKSSRYVEQDKRELNDSEENCNCNESTKPKSVGYMLELQKKAHESSKKAQDLLQKHEKKMESLKHSNEQKDCECNDAPGYIVELQKNTQDLCKNILEQQRNTIETLRHTHKLHDSNPKDACCAEVEKDTEGTSNIRELCKNILEKQKKTIETLKSIYLLQKQICTCNEQLRKVRDSNKLQLSKKTDELGKQIVESQHSTIESLKNDYLPSPKNTESKSDTGKENQCCSATAMLSAEVMHIPYSDLNDSLAYKPTYLPEKNIKLSKYDIFKRIKEAYQACSCKVCECIPGKTGSNNFCKCKPCECNDCASFVKKIVSKTSTRLNSRIKCRCNRCNNTGHCEGTHKRQPCDCLPCDCVKCTRSLAKSCDCEPCQCKNCKGMTIHPPQSLVVAAVEDNVQRTTCTCSPCDCIECGHRLPPNVHEMSTGTTRHAQCMCETCLNDDCNQIGLDYCKCEKRNKIMNKPVEKDTHDFDIRSVSIEQSKPFKRDDIKYNRRFDTIAMFAALPKNYPNFNNYNKLKNTKDCKCQECECISCACKEETINAIKSSHFFLCNKTITDLCDSKNSKLNSSNSCKCKLCECQICDKQKTQLKSNNKTYKHKEGCICSICDCLNCEGNHSFQHSSNELCQCSSEGTDCKTKVSKDLQKSEHCYRCSVCSTERCFGDMRLPNEIVHPIKRGNVLTASAHQTKVHNSILSKEHLETPSCSLQKASINLNSSYMDRDVSKYNAASKNYSHENLVKLFDTKYLKNINEILKSDGDIQSQGRNKGKPLQKKYSVDNEVSRSFLSGSSSCDTSTKISCHKDDDSITPISRNKNKSWESSCNSSGHDYPNYLIRFPKSPVENYLQDVIESDMDKTLQFHKTNIEPKQSAKEQSVNMVKHQNESGNELSKIHKNDLIETRNPKIIAIKQTETKMKNTYEETDNSKYTLQYRDFPEQANYRDYMYELSNGLHLHINKQNGEINDYKKNDKQIKDQNKTNESKNIKEIICNNNTESSKYFNFVQNFNDGHVAREVVDYNSKEQKAFKSFPMQNKQYCTWMSSEQLPPNYFAENHNSNDDNKRVQKTLQEAKEFSLELMKLLEMYEKANKEFESISGKLKMSHDSLSSDDFIEQKEISNAEEDISEKCKAKEVRLSEIENELQQIHLEAPSIREKITSTSLLTNCRQIPERTFAECSIDYNSISQKQGHTHLSKDILYLKEESEPIREHDSSDKLDSVIENNVLHRIEAHLSPCNINENRDVKDTIAKQSEESRNIKLSARKTEEVSSSNETDETVAIPDSSEIKKKEKLCKHYKKYSKLMKRTIIISKRVSIKKPSADEPKPVIKYCITEGTSTPFPSGAYAKLNDENPFNKDTEEECVVKKHNTNQIKQIIKKLDNVFESVGEVSTSTSNDTGVAKDEVSSNDLDDSKLEATKPWPILKKNFSWSTKPPTKNKGVCIFPSLELQIKQAVQSISLQTSSTTYPKKKSIVIPQRENKALAKLHVEVKKLLDMPILQPQNCSNCCDCTNEVLNVPHKSNSKVELKETPEVSLKLNRSDVKTVDQEAWCSYKNENLEAQIRELLYVTVLRPFFKKNNNLLLSENYGQYSKWMPNFVQPPKSSGCDTLKVCSLSVRRVSDHTMLVKWKVPQELSYVRGYELLVDGRPVKKIFSPEKSLAVVTCLPHTDKLLLTVRTITSGVSLNGHYPATTIIYQPRLK